jgi:regulator of sigma D
MLENCKTAQERWGGVSEIIDRWLGSRNELLVQYCALSEDVQFDDDEESAPSVREFCQDLIDYTSAGHFEIYDQLIQEGKEFDDQEGLSQAETLYAKIKPTTDFIVDFNDKYQEVDDLDAIENDLSSLGEVLANRFEAEDRMIEVLHYAHQEQLTD